MEFIRTIGKSEARKDFLQILNQFAQGLIRPILITDHGKPQAVIVPYEEYQSIKTRLENVKKPTKKRISIFGDDLEIIGDLENYSVWDQCKDEWEANWDKLLND